MSASLKEMLVFLCMIIGVIGIIAGCTTCEDHRSKARLDCYVATKDKEFCK